MVDISMLLKIVLTFAKIDCLSFGGGYAAIPIVEQQIVEVNKWMTYAEFSDVVAIDELTPGPVAINCATFVGMKMAGLPGAIAATIGNVLPSFILALILIKLYNKYHGLKTINGALSGLKCMVVALICSTSIMILKNAIYIDESINYLSIVLFLISLFIFRKYKPEPIIVILGCGAISLLFSMFYPII